MRRRLHSQRLCLQPWQHLQTRRVRLDYHTFLSVCIKTLFIDRWTFILHLRRAPFQKCLKKCFLMIPQIDRISVFGPAWEIFPFNVLCALPLGCWSAETGCFIYSEHFLLALRESVDSIMQRTASTAILKAFVFIISLRAMPRVLRYFFRACKYAELWLGVQAHTATTFSPRSGPAGFCNSLGRTEVDLA